MKKIKTVKNLVIYEMTEKELIKEPDGSKYQIYLKDSLEHGVAFGDKEWECDNLEEAIEWAECY